LGIRTAQQQRAGMSMIRRDDQTGRLEARRKLRDELALKEKQVSSTLTLFMRSHPKLWLF